MESFLDLRNILDFGRAALRLNRANILDVASILGLRNVLDLSDNDIKVNNQLHTFGRFVLILHFSHYNP